MWFDRTHRKEADGVNRQLINLAVRHFDGFCSCRITSSEVEGIELIEGGGERGLEKMKVVGTLRRSSPQQIKKPGTAT